VSWSNLRLLAPGVQYLEAKGKEIVALIAAERLLRQLNDVLTGSIQREEVLHQSSYL